VVGIPSFDYYSFIQEYFETNMLDVCTINNNNFQELVEKQVTDQLLGMEVKDSIYPFLMKPFMEDGQALVQPIFFSPVVLCYNRQHFREMDLPEPDSSWTWTDLLSAAQRLAIKNERYGFYFYMFDNHRWPLFPLQSGMVFEPDEDG